ncbi:MAG: alkaline phosphatase family protein [Acidobacteriaceae bacterium]
MIFPKTALLPWILLLTLLGPACGGSPSSSSSSSGASSSTSAGSVPRFSHVVLVVEENTSYQDVIGSSAMPYLNSLAKKYALATNYFADTHPSIGNYFMITTGEIATTNDSFSGTVSADNLVRQFMKDGKSWKSYAESIPSTGYLGGDSYPFLKRHVPFSYFSDVNNSTSLADNIVPFSSFTSDLSAGKLPNFSFITPDAEHDAHDCPGGGSACPLSDKLAAADHWLKTNIAQLISSSTFSDTLLIITFDEGDGSDSAHGGGHVATVIISPKAKAGYQGSGLYQHESLERLVGDALRLSAVPGAGSSAPSMSEFFQ